MLTRRAPRLRLIRRLLRLADGALQRLLLKHRFVPLLRRVSKNLVALHLVQRPLAEKMVGVAPLRAAMLIRLRSVPIVKK